MQLWAASSYTGRKWESICGFAKLRFGSEVKAKDRKEQNREHTWFQKYLRMML